ATEEPVAFVAQVEHPLDLDHLTGVRLLLPAAPLQFATDPTLTTTSPAAAPVAEVAPVTLCVVVLVVLVVLVVPIVLVLLTLVGPISVLLMWRRTLAILLRSVRTAPVRELGRLDEYCRPAVSRNAGDGLIALGRLGDGGGPGRRRRFGRGRRRSGSWPPGGLGAVGGATGRVAVGRAVGGVGLAVVGHAGGVKDSINDVGL